MHGITRLGILGGTFDPPHIAHMIAGEYAASEFELNKLLFIPAHIPPNKSGLPITPAADRMAMTQLAVKSNTKFDAYDIELRREGPSYTIDTIREIKSQNYIKELFVFIGQDQFADFKSWHKWKEILEESTVVVIARPMKNSSVIDRDLQSKVKFIQMPLLDISSTDIRERVRADKPIRYLVPNMVEKYIREHILYI